jgi:glyoxylase-like metal-dependent hydrolase (beta-lactamase superfamily II)
MGMGQPVVEGEKTMQEYEVYAVKYGHHERRSGENFIGGDEHDVPMALDFYVWAIKGPERTYVVDTGFSKETAARRQRLHLRCPGDGLRMVGVDAAEVEDVIITHMHYDHAGNSALFPRARYHVQDKEIDFCTGRCMCHNIFRRAFEFEDVAGMVRKVFEGRVQFHDGDEELAPGLSVHHIGGHTKGIQAVRVWTKRGWLVLASDTTHFYANMEQERPFPIVYDVAQMVAGYARLSKLASSKAHIIPGHDPLVLARYPAPNRELEGIAARLDVEPRT